MAVLWITNTATDAEGGTVPASVPAGTLWVGNIYTKNAGAVRKYLIKTLDSVDLSGLPGVVGPITPAELQAALSADGGSPAGWSVSEAQVAWALGGEA